MEFSSLNAMIDAANNAVEWRLNMGKWQEGWPGNLHQYLIGFLESADPRLAKQAAEERPDRYELSDKVGGNTLSWLAAIENLRRWERMRQLAVKPATVTPPAKTPVVVEPAADLPPVETEPPTSHAEVEAQPSTEALALALKADNPTWSDEKIAKAAGCHRSTLYTFPKYMAAKEILAKGKKTRPRGTKHADGTIEAWRNEENG